ncbi:hypothetical protein [Pedobacter sp. D749]|uniref:hypothetical protein n=1 Tax=Pedobacter sp. D749 TaxID=2856523 RepID=UPI001C57BD5C|nr:hypothetical protein [Pedobacter sp. D749]QXU42934.1 hypothetical protein KYH19_04875 [Pedobacter sp. D749]
MKKKLLTSIALVAILLFCLTYPPQCHGQSAVKTITYDWATKEILNNKSLPFDERFKFKIVNLDTKIKSVQVLIKEANGLVCNSPLDTICFNELPTVNELSFTSQKLQSVTVKNVLKPNKDYFIGFQIVERAKLTNEAQAALDKYLLSNADLGNEIDGLMRAKLAKLNIADINKVLYKYIKIFNGKYEVDTASITAEKKDDMQYQVLTAFLNLSSIGKKIYYQVHSLQTQYKISNELIAPLNDLIDTTSNIPECCRLKNGSSIDLLNGKLEKIKQEILKKSALDSAKKIELEDDYKSFVDDIQTELTTRNKAIKDWIGITLLGVVLDKTIMMIDLGTTTIDQQSTTSSPYISQSFGYGFSPRTSKGLFYFSYSIFFRPINLNVPLSNYTGKDYFATRFCANLGFTLEDIETNKSGKISGLGSLFSNKAGLIGIGYRPLPFLKIDFNYLMYYMNDPNPLLNQKRFTASPMIGASFNLNIIKIFTGQPNTLTSLKTYTEN